MNTYWKHAERGFANEYTIGVAAAPSTAAKFADAGYERITRRQAVADAKYKGDNATDSMVGLMINFPENQRTLDEWREYLNA